MSRRVLCVDDEPNLLQGLRRQFHGKLQLDIAVGPVEGLKTLDASGPYAVVVADMTMPVMNGAEFLAQVKLRAPDTVRIMLTGNADQQTATLAVNKGFVFRFLNKPCPAGELLSAIEQGIELHRATKTEREMLETTLSGSVKVMTEILALVHGQDQTEGPILRETACKLAKEMHLAEIWQVEVAGSLCRLGMVTLPPDLAARYASGQPIDRKGMELLARVPEVGHGLLSQIPRLEEVARIVLYHERGFDGSGPPLADGLKGTDLPLGARVLRCAAEFARLVSRETPPLQAVSQMLAQPAAFDPRALSALQEHVRRDVELRRSISLRSVNLADLIPGLTLASSILTKDGRLLLREGYPINQVVLERIRNMARLYGVQEPILVQDR